MYKTVQKFSPRVQVINTHTHVLVYLGWECYDKKISKHSAAVFQVIKQYKHISLQENAHVNSIHANL